MHNYVELSLEPPAYFVDSSIPYRTKITIGEARAHTEIETEYGEFDIVALVQLEDRLWVYIDGLQNEIAQYRTSQGLLDPDDHYYRAVRVHQYLDECAAADDFDTAA